MKIFDLLESVEIKSCSRELIDFSTEIKGFSIDSRTLKKGEIFVALKGNFSDGHEFVDEAFARGAIAVIVEREVLTVKGMVFLVEDSCAFLCQLAKLKRQNFSGKVIGITGSNGKTSTKDFTKSILSQKFKVSATLGNFNNYLGVSLSILAASLQDDFWVLELGISQVGEMDLLCQLAKPNLAIITHLGDAHIGNYTNFTELVAEKCKLVSHLKSDGICVLPHSIWNWVESHINKPVQIISPSWGEVYAKNIKRRTANVGFTLNIKGEEKSLKLPVWGEQMINNSLLAAWIGSYFGLKIEEITKGLSCALLGKGRSNYSSIKGIHIIDDTYNSNFSSTKAAIENLQVFNNKRKWVVLSGMKELGDFSLEAHLEVGKLVANRGIFLVAVGPDAKGFVEGAKKEGGNAYYYETPQEASDWLKKEIKKGEIILVKGSRQAQMEKVLESIFSIA